MNGIHALKTFSSTQTTACLLECYIQPLGYVIAIRKVDQPTRIENLLLVYKEMPFSNNDSGDELCGRNIETETLGLRGKHDLRRHIACRSQIPDNACLSWGTVFDWNSVYVGKKLRPLHVTFPANGNRGGRDTMMACGRGDRSQRYAYSWQPGTRRQIEEHLMKIATKGSRMAVQETCHMDGNREEQDQKICKRAQSATGRNYGERAQVTCRMATGYNGIGTVDVLHVDSDGTEIVYEWRIEDKLQTWAMHELTPATKISHEEGLLSAGNTPWSLEIMMAVNKDTSVKFNSGG
ncbi:hypothetical protein EDD15DRAFT_2201063 [Pisolithus albus]|nr:hypothetical protein EDD15DRAFT_2201063 [Pisolithus albus]